MIRNISNCRRSWWKQVGRHIELSSYLDKNRHDYSILKKKSFTATLNIDFYTEPSSKFLTCIAHSIKNERKKYPPKNVELVG